MLGHILRSRMIRKTLKATQAATWSINLPDNKGMPVPTGTGFFVSPEGWFITAAHVVSKNEQGNPKVRDDIDKGDLMKEGRSKEDWGCKLLQQLAVEFVDFKTDLALLRVDFEANRKKDSMKGKSAFHYIEVSSRELDEGEAVYSFGYPLAKAITHDLEGAIIGESELCPRITSAIVSSNFERTRMVMAYKEPKVYVLDKALNYGNSGGPILSVETGKVHAICSWFQPVFIPQPHLRIPNGEPLKVMVPSLYGVVSSLANASILEKLREKGVPISST